MARQAINGQRKNLVLSTTTDQRIKAIRNVSELPSDAEVIRKAVDLYSQVIKLQALGYQIIVTTDQGSRDLSHLFKKGVMAQADDNTLASLDIPRSALAQAVGPVFELA